MALSIPVFIVGSALFYTASMVAMKFWGQGVATPLILGVIVLSVAVGIFMEIEALREERLGMVYVGILAAEVVLVAVASKYLFGESFTAKELVGGGLIVAGTAVAWA